MSGQGLVSDGENYIFLFAMLALASAATAEAEEASAPLSGGTIRRAFNSSALRDYILSAATASSASISVILFLSLRRCRRPTFQAAGRTREVDRQIFRISGDKLRFDFGQRWLFLLYLLWDDCLRPRTRLLKLSTLLDRGDGGSGNRVDRGARRRLLEEETWQTSVSLCFLNRWDLLYVRRLRWGDFVLIDLF
jgi:hypothetical protein